MSKRTKTVQPLQYAIGIRRTALRSFPTETHLYDDITDADFDYLYNASAVLVNQPMVIYSTSADGNYYAVWQEDCSGWVKKVITLTVIPATPVNLKAAVNQKTAAQKYYMRVRAYKTVKNNGKTMKIYSGWSGKIRK